MLYGKYCHFQQGKIKWAFMRTFEYKTFRRHKSSGFLGKKNMDEGTESTEAWSWENTGFRVIVRSRGKLEWCE